MLYNLLESIESTQAKVSSSRVIDKGANKDEIGVTKIGVGLDADSRNNDGVDIIKRSIQELNTKVIFFHRPRISVLNFKLNL